MDQTSIERLKDYLAQLPPKSQALLMTKSSSARRSAAKTPRSPTLVLDQLRRIVRRSGVTAKQRREDPAQHLFRHLESVSCGGRLSCYGPGADPAHLAHGRSGSGWRARGAPAAARAFEAALGPQRDIRLDRHPISRRPRPQDSAGRGSRDPGGPSRIVPGYGSASDATSSGSPSVVEDLEPQSERLLNARDALDTLNSRLPEFSASSSARSQIASGD